MKSNEILLTPHFKLIEFECPCCHTVRLHPKLLQMLEALRERWKRPLVITSGFRCRAHNDRVGGVRKSFHLLGQAVDIRMGAQEVSPFLKIAHALGPTELIPYSHRGFVHLGFA